MPWASMTQISIWKRVHSPWLWGRETALSHLDILMLFWEWRRERGRAGGIALSGTFLVWFPDPCHEATCLHLDQQAR